MKRVDSDTQKEIVDSINRLIADNNTDVTNFAESIGVSRNNVNDWLRGKSDIRLGDLITISNTYGKSVDWLLGLVPRDKDSNIQEVQIASDYTGLNHEAVDLLHLHNAKKAFQNRIEGLNFLLCNFFFYMDCLPSIEKIIRLSEKVSDYALNLNTGVISDSGEITFDPYTAAKYYAQEAASNLQSLLDNHVQKNSNISKEASEAAKYIFDAQEKIYLAQLKRDPHPIERLIEDMNEGKAKELAEEYLKYLEAENHLENAEMIRDFNKELLINERKEGDTDSEK